MERDDLSPGRLLGLALVAAIGTVTLAYFFAPASVLVAVFALAIVAVAGAYLRGIRVGR